METKQYTPTLEDVKNFLDEYGWKYKDCEDDLGKYISAGLYLVERNKSSILTFYIAGDFLLVNTTNLLTNIPVEYARRLLEYNDNMKLVKLFSKPNEDKLLMNAEVGFELWADAFNKETFFAFMDMLATFTEYLLDRVEEDKIPCKIGILDINREQL